MVRFREGEFGKLMGINDHSIGLLDNHDGVSAPTLELAELLDGVGGAADVAVAQKVASIAGPGADVAALGVEVHELDGLAEPAGDQEERPVPSRTADPEEVAPPAIAAHALTHNE